MWIVRLSLFLFFGALFSSSNIMAKKMSLTYDLPNEKKTTLFKQTVNKHILEKTVPNHYRRGNTTPAAKSPLKPAAKSPLKPAAKTPLKRAVKIPLKPAAKTPLKAAAKTPLKRAAKIPLKPAEKTPLKRATKAPIKPAAKAPIKPAAKTPLKSAAKSPLKPTAKTPLKPAAKIPLKPGEKTPLKRAAKAPIKSAAKSPLKSAAKTPLKPIITSTEKGVKSKLLNYLKDKDIPKPVLDLAKIGYKKYQTEPLKSQITARKWDALRGGRNANWIKETFGMTEDKITKQFSQLPPPPIWKAKEIDAVYKSVKTGIVPTTIQDPSFYLVQNVGINGLHRTVLGQNAIVQLASQFNYLESPGPYHVPVSQYLYDFTQGPQGAIESASATLYRDAAVMSGKLPHALRSVLPLEHKNYYNNGYLELGKLTSKECKNIKTSIDNNLMNIEILPQWVMCESTGAYQLQVFASAPSFQGFQRPEPGSHAAQIAEQLVTKQYEMIGKLAAIHSIGIKKRVPLHLTLVGQGAFNNPNSIIEKALNAVAGAVKGYNVGVYVHTFSASDKKKMMDNLMNPSFKMIHLTREEFKNMK